MMTTDSLQQTSAVEQVTDCTLHRQKHLYTNTVSSLLLSSSLFVFFFSNLSTDSHMDRTSLEFNLSLHNKNSSHCHLDIAHH